MSAHPPSAPPERRIFCNRTLNLRSIQAIGYDMDYTLVHYNVAEWEGRAYEHIKQRLGDEGWPVGGLEFRPDLMTRGLVIDLQCGNVVKANRFGYIKQAMHGTHRLEFHDLRRTYARMLVDLGDARWEFMNTLFSISEACIYAQLVDLLDAGKLPEPLGYEELYRRVRWALDGAHVEGKLKQEIMAEPQRYVELEPHAALALLDQKEAGKKLMLITNSGWNYTRFMMEYAFEQFLPDGMRWKDLFDLVVVSARKPAFFMHDTPMFEVVTDDGLLRPVVGPIRNGGIYLGGHASRIEECLGLDGEQILYVGDHIYGDVNVSKSILRWRTALILRELEVELCAVESAVDAQQKISALMQDKERLEHEMSAHKLALQRAKKGYGDPVDVQPRELERLISDLRQRLLDLDAQIGPLVMEDGKAFNELWGYLLRAGNDKSHLTRQLERYADIYTSRVSNFVFYTPFMYFRSPRGSLPHDPGVVPQLDRAD